MIVSVHLKLLDRLSAPGRRAKKVVSGLGKSFRSMANSARSSTRALGSFASAANKAGQRLARLRREQLAFNRAQRQMGGRRGKGMGIRSMVAGAGGGYIGGSFVRKLIKQSQAENDVMARVTGSIDSKGRKLLKTGSPNKFMNADASSAAIASFRKSMKEIALVTKFDTTQLWQGALQGATAGLTLPQIEKMMSSTAKFAQAGGGNLTIDKAMDVSTNIANAFKIPLSRLPQVQNQIAAIANSTNSTIQEVAEAIKMSAPGIMAAGGNLNEALAAIATMAQFGMKGTLGGTTLARIKEKINTPGKPAIAALKKIGLKPGDFKTKDGKIKTFIQMMEIFEKAAKKAIVSANDVNAAMDKVFGLRGSRGSKLLVNDIPKLKKYLEIARAAEKNFMGENSALAIMSKIQLEGLYGAFEIMRAMFHSALIDIGDSGLNEDLTRIIFQVRKGIQWFGKLNDSTKNFVGIVVLLGAAIAAVSIPLAIVVASLKVLGLGSLLGAFAMYAASMMSFALRLNTAKRAALGLNFALRTLKRLLRGAFFIGALSGIYHEFDKIKAKYKELKAEFNKDDGQWGQKLVELLRLIRTAMVGGVLDLFGIDDAYAKVESFFKWFQGKLTSIHNWMAKTGIGKLFGMKERANPYPAQKLMDGLNSYLEKHGKTANKLNQPTINSPFGPAAGFSEIKAAGDKTALDLQTAGNKTATGITSAGATIAAALDGVAPAIRKATAGISAAGVLPTRRPARNGAAFDSPPKAVTP